MIWFVIATIVAMGCKYMQYLCLCYFITSSTHENRLRHASLELFCAHYSNCLRSCAPLPNNLLRRCAPLPINCLRSCMPLPKRLRRSCAPLPSNLLRTPCNVKVSPFFKVFEAQPCADISRLAEYEDIKFFEFGQRLPLPLANFRLKFVCYNNVRNI